MTDETQPSGATAVFGETLTVPEEYRRACRFLGLDSAPARLLGWTLGGAAGCWLVGLAVLALGSGPAAVVVGVGWLVASGLIAGLGRYGPPLAARTRRITALGAAPSLVGLLALGVRLWPSTERTASFAVRADEGTLAERLGAQQRRARGTPRGGLSAFADAWSETFPALDDAVDCVERAAAAPAAERAAVCATARRRILDGTRTEMATFAADLRAPATGVYAFGVLLPLALVSLLPAASAAGVPVTPALLVVTYGMVLPVTLTAASAWLVTRRPVAFPPTPVPRTHPDVPSTPANAVAAGTLAAVGCWLVATVAVPQWGPPVVALGGGVGAGLVVHYRPAHLVRGRVTALESALPDTLAAVGRRVDRGQSVEAALAEVADLTDGPLASLVEATLDRQQTLGVTVGTAFYGEYGTLASSPSRRLRRAAALLDAAATIGPPAGETLTAMGDHLDELAAVERETQRELAQVTGTFANTGALFGPLVGGVTVGLAGTMGSSGPFTAVANGVLGPVVGWYCLVLAAVLTALSTALDSGFDRAVVGYRVGLALCSGTAVYPAALVATRTLV